MNINTDKLLEDLKPEQLDLVNKYQAVYHRVQTLQTRMEIIKTDLEDALNELNSLRDEENLKQIINTHGKK